MRDTTGKFILEMMDETKKAYTYLVHNSHGYYHAGRCVDCLKLFELLSQILNVITNESGVLNEV